MCIYAGRAGNTVLFHHEGGVDVGDVDAKVRLLIYAQCGVSMQLARTRGKSPVCALLQCMSLTPSPSSLLMSYLSSIPPHSTPQATRVEVDIEGVLTDEQASALVANAGKDQRPLLVEYLQQLYRAYTELYFTYLEINPLGVVCVCTVFWVSSPVGTH